MGLPVFIVGKSGSGKSTSLRNFKNDEVTVLSVVGKRLPFKTDVKCYNINRISKELNKDRYSIIKGYLTSKKINSKSFVIDDSQYLLAYESFDKANDKGYDKFTNMAVHFKNLIEYVTDDLPDDVIVYFLHHSETTDFGDIKIKTLGKMLDNQLTVEGLSIIVLFCITDGNVHKFVTQSDGKTTAKSPMEMFDLEIDNDLKMVDETIRNYYSL